MRRLLPVGMVWAFGLAVLAAVPALALQRGDPAPDLTIDPVNDDSDEAFSPIADAEGGVILAFINGTAIAGDVPEDLQVLIRLFSDLSQEQEENGLTLGYMIVVGEYDRDQIAKWAEDNELACPIALKAPDDEELGAWDLPGDATAVVYLIREDSVGQETNDPEQYDDVFGVGKDDRGEEEQE